jgi:hypothetical protein
MTAGILRTARRGWAIGTIATLAVGFGCNELTGAGSYVVDHSVDAAPDVGPEDHDVVVVDSGPVTVPDAAIDAAPVPKRVFVTNETFSGNLGGRAGGDAKCVSAAADAGLGGQWVAWLSVPGGNAIEHIDDGPYVLVDGSGPIAANKTELVSGHIAHAINMTESKVVLTENRGVWTGTSSNGTVAETCSGWELSSKTIYGTLGSTLATDDGWTKGAGAEPPSEVWPCSTEVSLYCFEQ